MEDILVFFSGASRLPPLGFQKSPTLNFSEENLYPTASTCSLILNIPTRYGSDYESFKGALHIDFKFHGGFGKL